jgi:dTDP-4-amino-4,6-dideoxygalactose transaminase
MIPVFKPDIPRYRSLKKSLREIDRSLQYTNFGPKTRQLEELIAHEFKVSQKNITSVSNATLAIEGALICEKESYMWTVPSWTFVAPVHSLIRANKDFMFVDIDNSWRSLGINSQQDNDAILDVLPFGDDIDLKRFKDFDGTILVDGAGSFDSLKNFSFPNNKRVGIVMSFHATKSMPGAEGGIFVSNDSEWVSRVRNWSNFGFADTRSAEFVGTNAKMHEYSAAIILASLHRWPKDREVWKNTNSWALNLSIALDLEVNPALKKDFATPYWIIRNKADLILELEKYLESYGVQTRRWWGFGCHRMKAFDNIKIDLLGLKNTDEIASETLGLPMYKNISVSDKKKIASLVEHFCSQLI